MDRPKMDNNNNMLVMTTRYCKALLRGNKEIKKYNFRKQRLRNIMSCCSVCIKMEIGHNILEQINKTSKTRQIP